MKLKIFPLSTHHILSFKIYQKIRIIFILLQKTSKRQYHLFVFWFKATQRKEQHSNLFDKNSLSISRCFSKTLTTLTKGWKLLQTWLLNSLVFLRHAQKETCRWCLKRFLKRIPHWWRENILNSNNRFFFTSQNILVEIHVVGIIS